jgi:predicted nucleic acid-binding protein
MIIVADTSPILNLDVIGRLDLLHQLFGEIIIPPAVDSELRAEPYGFVPPAWLTVMAPTAGDRIVGFLGSLDRGEAEAIVLASEIQADFILIDERRGRAAATQHGLRSLGLLGVLLLAKRQGLIANIAPVLDSLLDRAGMWIAASLRERVLRDAGEFDEIES